MVELNVLHRLRDLYRDIDRCLDVGDAKGFSLASHELLDVLHRLRDLIDSTSVADIVSFVPPVQTARSA
jgi:hypothetical protein